MRRYNSFVFHLLEPEPLIQPQRGIETLDVDRERFAGGTRFFLQLVQQLRPDPGAAMFRQQRDVHDPDLALPMRDVQPPDRNSVALDYLKRCAGIIFPVMRALRIELPPAENRLVFIAPAR